MQEKNDIEGGKRNQHGIPKLRDIEGVWGFGYQRDEGLGGRMGRSGGGSKTAAASKSCPVEVKNPRLD